jgi:hypothetical protein
MWSAWGVRKFFGVVDPSGAEYRACVALRPDDDRVKWGLDTGTIHGGLYFRVRLRGEPPEIYEQITPRMAQLEASTDRDVGPAHRVLPSSRRDRSTRPGARSSLEGVRTAIASIVADAEVREPPGLVT